MAPGLRVPSEERQDCSCVLDQQGDSRMPRLECICGELGCPTSIAAAVDELAAHCRPYFEEFDPEIHPNYAALERRDGCGVIELTMASGFEHRSYVFEARTGALVGAMQSTRMCPRCGGCAYVAGRAHEDPLCPEAHVCRLCGPAEGSRAPACEPARACGADVTTPRPPRLFRPDAPDAGVE
jgi:hypothetical protein